jgi:16S rRNA (guanine(966)-N(2))-methyltransferase RsmD
MRVIAGTAKGMHLESVPGENTRPITDRAKEALFAILGEAIQGATVLDLFGGTGAVGIEALSRGAARVVFIERSRTALKVLSQNLERTRLADRGVIVHGDAFKYLAQPAPAAFDVIFVAPPQYRGLWLKALQLLDRQPHWLAPEGQVIVQLHPKEYTDPALAHLWRRDSRRYGSVQLDFYVRRAGSASGEAGDPSQGARPMLTSTASSAPATNETGGVVSSGRETT